MRETVKAVAATEAEMKSRSMGASIVEHADAKDYKVPISNI